ncbi:hypothetical protein [Viridibacillus arvi]|uniref:Uncharacterized protein n=1 Tax=Viridibacillus arvi TaxID=263475 RepID=A0A0M0L9T8_9BACL|nr:hypothetical protein [Viridibacillus arvi]KOO47809.1 hypothetical protein AMD00_19425 [Viridibacillus arvi]
MFNKSENFVDLQDMIEELEHKFIKLGFYTDSLTKYYQIGKVSLERSDEVLFSGFKYGAFTMLVLEDLPTELNGGYYIINAYNPNKGRS